MAADCSINEDDDIDLELDMEIDERAQEEDGNESGIDSSDDADKYASRQSNLTIRLTIFKLVQAVHLPVCVCDSHTSSLDYGRFTMSNYKEL
jgi:hypothetical protein